MTMSLQDRHARRARRLDDPAFDRFRTPVARRALVFGLGGLMAAEAALIVVAGSATILALIGLAVVLVLVVLCLGTLKATTRGVEELPAGVLDERQAAVRGEVYTRAYRVGMSVLTTELAVVLGWLMLHLPAPGTGVVTAALVLTFQGGIVLPTVVAALTEKD